MCYSKLSGSDCLILGTRVVFCCIMQWQRFRGYHDVIMLARHWVFLGVGETNTTSHVITDFSKRDWAWKVTKKRKFSFDFVIHCDSLIRYMSWMWRLAMDWACFPLLFLSLPSVSYTKAHECILHARFWKHILTSGCSEMLLLVQIFHVPTPLVSVHVSLSNICLFPLFISQHFKFHWLYMV
jgi:hypothetical protein